VWALVRDFHRLPWFWFLLKTLFQTLIRLHNTDDRPSLYRLSHDSQQFVTIIVMDNIERHFAGAVIYHRKRLVFSQEAFAVKARIHRTCASSIKRAKVQMSMAVASQLAGALGIPLSTLFRDAERFASMPTYDTLPTILCGGNASSAMTIRQSATAKITIVTNRFHM